MANFKRKKSKRSVKCTMCTQFRWMGNGKNRRPAKEKTIRGTNSFMEWLDDRLQADPELEQGVKEILNEST